MYLASVTDLALFAWLIFAFVALFMVGAFLLWDSSHGSNARKIAGRLETRDTTAQLARKASLHKPFTPDASSFFPHLTWILPLMRTIEGRMRQAGMAWSAIRLLLICPLSGLLCGAVISLLMHQPIEIGFAVGMVAMYLPYGYVIGRRTKRLMGLGQQLPDMLSYLVRYLRTGGALPFGLQMISEKLPEPIAGEFRILHDEISFGLSLHDALANLAARVPTEDVRFFVTAMMINSETGGNIIEILDNLCRLIRERQKLQAKVKVLTSEGVLSAWTLIAMPFVLAAVLFALTPQLMSGLWTDPIGIPLVQGALVLMVIGIVVLRKMVRIRV